MIKNVVYLQKFKIPIQYNNVYEYIVQTIIIYYTGFPVKHVHFSNGGKYENLESQSEYLNTLVQPYVFMYTVK